MLTANPGFTAPDAEIAHTPVQAVFTAGEEAAVIGGESVYRLFLPLCERVYITKVFANADADAFFPDLDADPHWQVKAKFLRTTASATSSWTTFPRRKRTIWLTCSPTAASRCPLRRRRISPI